MLRELRNHGTLFGVEIPEAVPDAEPYPGIMPGSCSEKLHPSNRCGECPDRKDCLI
jgi:hypothetical protein